MTDTQANITAVLAALHDDPATADSKYTLAQAAGLKPAQVEYLLYGRKDETVLAAWHDARTTLAEQRCRERTCSTCRQTYPADGFPKDASDPCGIARRCKTCNRLHAKDAYRRRRNG